MPRHVIARIVYALELIECSCGAEIRAEPDTVLRDRHEPLVAAWAAHRHGLELAELRRARGRSFVPR